MLTYGFSWCSICYMDTNNHLIDKCLAETYKHIKIRAKTVPDNDLI